jgi:hypothetical protein
MYLWASSYSQNEQRYFPETKSDALPCKVMQLLSGRWKLNCKRLDEHLPSQETGQLIWYKDTPTD